MKVIICCNKGDYFFTRLCAASVRYYYPDIPIYIIKDCLRGKFDTTELEQAMQVQVLDLGIQRFGWSAAKIHLLLSDFFANEKLLVLDSDIVLAGAFLTTVFPSGAAFDFAINCEPALSVSEPFVKDIYYDIDYIRKRSPDFEFPGYFFNGGQMVITTGKITKDEIADFFDPDNYPYWKMLDKFPCVDQSLLNYLLPLKEKRNEIKLLKPNFMLWTGDSKIDSVSIQGLKAGEYPFLIHWAGELRINYFSRMKRPDILRFFEDYYYQHVRFALIKRYSRKLVPALTYHLRKLYQKIK